MDNNEENKLVYLQMIQGISNRLSSTSASFKGFAITLFAGVLAVVFSIGGSHRVLVLAFAFIGLSIIAGFDCWYFQMEKRYRKLYELVLAGDHDVDFDLSNDKTIVVPLSEVFTSKAIWLFYLVLLGVYLLLIILCALGCL